MIDEKFKMEKEDIRLFNIYARGIEELVLARLRPLVEAVNSNKLYPYFAHTEAKKYSFGILQREGDDKYYLYQRIKYVKETPKHLKKEKWRKVL